MLYYEAFAGLPYVFVDPRVTADRDVIVDDDAAR
jgi:hypothetical protein